MALNNGEIDEREFQVLQDLHLKVIIKLSNVDHKMELRTRNQLQKSLLEDKESLKNERCFMICSLFPVCYTMSYQMDKLQDNYYQPNHLWKDQKAIKKLKEVSKEKPAIVK